MKLGAVWRRFQKLDRAQKYHYARRFVDLYLLHRSGFSQFGEDASVIEYLRTIGVREVSYLDIGANHPIIHSNTYSFYRDGARGVVVDANPAICKLLRRKRPRDVVVNRGVTGRDTGTRTLHIMDLDGLSTLSDSWSNQLIEQELGTQVASVEVELIGINELLAEQFSSTTPTFVSLDIEGVDLEVIEAWDFTRWRPLLMCIETSVLTKGRYRKDDRYTAVMRDRRYTPLFETFANTVYLRDD